MDLAPGGQLLLTFLSPVYCPNQKLLKKKKKIPNVVVVWQVAGFSGRERELWVKG